MASPNEYPIGCITFVTLILFVLLTNVRYVTFTVPCNHHTFKVSAAHAITHEAKYSTPPVTATQMFNSADRSMSADRARANSSLLTRDNNATRTLGMCSFRVNQTYACADAFDSQFYRVHYDLHHLLVYPPTTLPPNNSPNAATRSEDTDPFKPTENHLSMEEEVKLLKEHYLSKGIRDGYAFHPGPKTLKIVLMTMNEWPMLKSWVLYHGHLFGFENLYIVSGCTEAEPLNFLQRAKRILGVNVLYTTASLNEIGKEIQQLMKSLQFSSDFITKLDTDEFISYFNSSSNELQPDQIMNHLSYELPYDGRKYKFGYRMSAFPIKPVVKEEEETVESWGNQSKVSSENPSSTKMMTVGSTAFVPIDTPTNLDAPRLFDYFQKPTLENMKGNGKTLFASPTFGTFDLGNHRGLTLPAYQDMPDYRSSLVNIHFHFQSHWLVQESNRKALLSHGYITSSDSKEEQIRKCQEWLLKAPPSRHKIQDYLDYLRHPELHEKLYYQRFFVTGERSGTSPDKSPPDNLLHYTRLRKSLDDLYARYNYL